MDKEFLVFFKSTWYKLSWVALFWVWVGFYLGSNEVLQASWYGTPAAISLTLVAYTSLAVVYRYIEHEGDKHE